MSEPSDTHTEPDARRLDHILHEVVETLALLDRTPCSPGERQAAQWLAARLLSVDGVEVSLEDEPSWGTFPPTATSLAATGLVGALLVRRGRRRTGSLLAALALASMVDEVHNGPRVARRLLRRRRKTVNVVARIGDQRAAEGDLARSDGGGAEAVGTVVVLAHHDAPQAGLLFDQTLVRKLYEVAPQVIESTKTPPPQWWGVFAGPLLTIAAAATRSRALGRAAIGFGALATAALGDLWRNVTVQGANDNLSGVAALVALAELLRERPLPGVRVLLVSCGAEETLQDGIRAFMTRHRHELAPERTWFINLDTIGSPHLVGLEAEGPIRMEEYAGPWLRDLVSERAEQIGVQLERGYRARASTDSVIPSRAGYPIATLVSITDWRSPANYHLASDIPANLDYGTVAEATRLVYEVIRSLAEDRSYAAAGSDAAAGSSTADGSGTADGRLGSALPS
jgi:hypothetical protein